MHYAISSEDYIFSLADDFTETKGMVNITAEIYKRVINSEPQSPETSGLQTRGRGASINVFREAI